MNDADRTYDEWEALHREAEALRQKAEAWTWKRFLVAVGFGLVIPVLLFALFHASGTKQAIQPPSPYGKAVAMESGDGERMLSEQKAMIRSVEADLARAAMKARAEAKLPVSVESDHEAVPPALDPTLGLLSIAVLGLGFLAFRNRDENAGWGISAALGLLGGFALGYYAYGQGSFAAFDSFLSLRPAEFLNLPVSRSVLVLFAAVTAILGLRQFPELVNSCLLLIQEILRGIGRGISFVCRGYATTCWWLAQKLVPVR